MSFISMHELLRFAEEHCFGVPAINVFNYESIKFAVKAAEEARMPIIIQYYPGLAEHASLDDIRTATEEFIGNASVPVTLHLDHSPTFEIAVDGLRARFPSIMVDGSSLPYEENLALTSSVVRCAHVMKADVEAELGHVGVGMNAEDFQDRDKFTDPDQAADFVSRTGCDSLAVAVGNAHGNYIKLPELDFDRIRTLRAKLDIPLVMHGGSDIPYDQMQEAVRCGMSKFNIATEYQRCFYRASRSYFAEDARPDNYFGYLRAIERPAVDFVKAKITMLNPDGFSL